MDTPKVLSAEPVARDPCAYPTSPARLPKAAKPILALIDLEGREPAPPKPSQREESPGPSKRPYLELEPAEPIAHPRLYAEAPLSFMLSVRSRLSPSQRTALHKAGGDGRTSVSSADSSARK